MAEAVVEAYLSRGIGFATSRCWDRNESAPGSDVARLRSVEVLAGTDVSSGVIEIKERIGIALDYEVIQAGLTLVPNIHVHFQGARAFVALDTSEGAQLRSRDPGVYRTVAWIPGNLLAEGTTTIDVALSTLRPNHAHFYVPDALSFQVFDDMQGESARGIYAEPLPGVVRPKLEWVTDGPRPDQR
jgi:lipopolysaccharide transport system ATP-binding protein